MKYIPVRNYTIPGVDGDPVFAPHLSVDDRAVTWTGLIDEQGNPICRVQDPIGFDIERAHG
jgi:hypothetical protein